MSSTAGRIGFITSESLQDIIRMGLNFRVPGGLRMLRARRSVTGVTSRPRQTNRPSAPETKP